MFKKLIESLGKMDYMVTIESGNYIVREKDTGKDYLSFSVGSKDKENLLIRCYSELLGEAGTTN